MPVLFKAVPRMLLLSYMPKNYSLRTTPSSLLGQNISTMLRMCCTVPLSLMSKRKKKSNREENYEKIENSDFQNVI